MKCLDCRGMVNRFEPKRGRWLVHTIRGVTEQHWTFPGRSALASTICGRVVVHEEERE